MPHTLGTTVLYKKLETQENKYQNRCVHLLLTIHLKQKLQETLRVQRKFKTFVKQNDLLFPPVRKQPQTASGSGLAQYVVIIRALLHFLSSTSANLSKKYDSPQSKRMEIMAHSSCKKPFVAEQLVRTTWSRQRGGGLRPSQKEGTSVSPWVIFRTDTDAVLMSSYKQHAWDLQLLLQPHTLFFQVITGSIMKRLRQINETWTIFGVGQRFSTQLQITGVWTVTTSGFDSNLGVFILYYCKLRFFFFW